MAILIVKVSIFCCFQAFFNIENVDIASPTHTAEKKGNFYADPNVSEVKASFEVLELLKAQIGNLLKEWPEHPTLQTVFYYFCVQEKITN